MSYPPGSPDPSSGEPERDERPDEAGDADPWQAPYPGQPSPDAPYYGPPSYAQQPAYPAPQYGPPGYAPYAYPGYPRPRNGKATAAMWTGIGSLVLSFCCGAGVLGLVPIVLGVKARSEIRASGGQQEGDGMALTGIITGAVAVVLSLVVIAVIVIALATGGADNGTFGETGV